ncbi:MAG: hypothetical protein KDA80_07655, partial [Planctomycetaceae bacterium]|nr:hypothetical protein [Planctomycetaceae bacterium]
YLVGTIVLLGLFSIGVAVWKPWQNTATLPTERRELANSSSTADVPGTALSKELSGPESKSPLIGKWRLYSGFLPRGGEAEIEFSPDGTVRIGQDGNEIEGTSDASSIQLRFASLPEMENVTVTPARQTVDVFVEPAGDNNFIQPPYTVFSFRPHERWTLSIFDSQHLYGRRAHSSAWDQQDAPSGAVAEIQIEEIALFHESSEPGPPFLNYPGEQLIGVWETGGLSAQRESVQFEFNRSGDFFTTIDGQRFGGRSGEGNVQQTYRVTTSDDPAKYGWTIFSRKPNEQAERVTLVDDVTFQSKERWEIDLMQLTGARNPPQVAFTRYEINYVSKEIPYDVNVVVDGETRKERRVRAFYQYVPVTKTFAASKVFY